MNNSKYETEAFPTLKEILSNNPLVYKRVIQFSLAIGVLSLSSTIYMLEVYDRVINSRNSFTLMMLLIAVISAYVVMEILEYARVGAMRSIGIRLDDEIAGRLFDISIESRLKGYPGFVSQFMSDLRIIREFLSSGAVMAVLDLPISIVFLVVIFILSPWLGVLALIGAVIQFWIAVKTETKTMPLLTEANRSSIEAQNYANGALRNAQVVEAMGMMKGIHARWLSKQAKFISNQANASDFAGVNSATSKFIMSMQTSLLLGASCWLTLKGQMLGGGGMMIVASTLGGKILTPLVQLVAQWQTVVNARDSYQRLNNVLNTFPQKEVKMKLPEPVGMLSVENVIAGAPGGAGAIIRGINFVVQPGECVAVIGSSGSGKTTLARAMVGIWSLIAGKVRLDGADVHLWNKVELGPYLGYLPQTIELFDGTIADNVARFGIVDKEEVVKVLDIVGLSDVVNKLTNGIEAEIGDDGFVLSGGQRQRLALARAMYKLPKLIILDEPNSNLDEAGEISLINALKYLKENGSTVIIITHRTNILPAADKILFMREGQVAAFGPRDEVLTALSQSASK